jgi:ribosomal protein S18 acetylase RimI-like enzyme
MQEIDIRYSYVTDAHYLKKWLNAPGMLHWFPLVTEKEIDGAVQSWLGMVRFGAALTATLANVPCGMGVLFLMPYKKVSHQCMFKLIVDPQYQRRGVGTTLIRNLKHLAKNYFQLDLIHIEVFEGNPLIEMLYKLDFHQFGFQEKFVKDGENYLSRVLLESYL